MLWWSRFSAGKPFRIDKLLLFLSLHNNELHRTNYKLVTYFVFLNHVHVKQSLSVQISFLGKINYCL